MPCASPTAGSSSCSTTPRRAQWRALTETMLWRTASSPLSADLVRPRCGRSLIRRDSSERPPPPSEDIPIEGTFPVESSAGLTMGVCTPCGGIFATIAPRTGARSGRWNATAPNTPERSRSPAPSTTRRRGGRATSSMASSKTTAPCGFGASTTPRPSSAFRSWRPVVPLSPELAAPWLPSRTPILPVRRRSRPSPADMRRFRSPHSDVLGSARRER